MKCGHCGRDAGGYGYFCAYCGKVLHGARPTAYEHDDERFAAAEQHPSYPAAMRHEPEVETGMALAMGTVMVTFALVFTVVAASIAPFMAIFGLGFTALVLYGLVYRPIQLARAPVERTLAIVVNERTNVSGNSDSTSTSYYATLQFRDGSRREMRCAGHTAGQIARGDIGVACTKLGSYLAGFVRIPV